MAEFYGILTRGDAARLINEVGQRQVWDLAQKYLATYNAQFQQAQRFLVQATVTEPTLRYYLPGGGRMQRRGGLAPSHAIRTGGQWDAAFPIEEFGDQIAATRTTLAKMTVEKFNNVLESVRIRDMNTRRFEMLKAVLNNTARSFVDDDAGTLTIQPLANGDATLYPPLMGTEVETTIQSYASSGYAPAAISDANNPIRTIVTQLTARFGTSTTESNIAVMIHQDNASKVEDLTDFDEVNDRFIIAGANADRLTGMPVGVPGRLIGRCSGAWVFIWPSMPSNYMFGLDLDMPRPIMERVPQPGTGLVGGLQLITETADAVNYPFDQSHFESHFGYGAGNRLNGYALFLDAGGAYVIPAAYV
jgi:hypothetical protein